MYDILGGWLVRKHRILLFSSLHLNLNRHVLGNYTTKFNFCTKVNLKTDVLKIKEGCNATHTKDDISLRSFLSSNVDGCKEERPILFFHSTKSYKHLKEESKANRKFNVTDKSESQFVSDTFFSERPLIFYNNRGFNSEDLRNKSFPTSQSYVESDLGRSTFYKSHGDKYSSSLEDKRWEDDPQYDDARDSIQELMWRPMHSSPSELLSVYKKLSKFRLTMLVVVTQMMGYAMAPGLFSFPVFAAATVGTTCISASANAVNQTMEVPFDSQMKRTRNRPIVLGLISSGHAMTFAAVTGAFGITFLLCGCNALTALLGAFNLFFYTCVYTPLKRVSGVNTWVGSVVGAVPPLMGWTAATGGIELGGVMLSLLLYAWQFPHFNALSWNLRGDYCRGGFSMVSVTNPDLCKRVALRYCFFITALCPFFSLIDLTSWTFAVDSLPANLYLTYLGWQFYRKGDSQSSRKLFRFSLLHLPITMLLMLIGKKQLGVPQEHDCECNLSV